MARARNIMVGFDGSEGADRALERAAELLGYGSILTVVTVSNNGTSSSETVERAREQLLRRQLSATYLERRGDPTSLLVDSAEAIGADLVVVGRTRNRPPAADGLGTVSAGVVRSAPCDVLVVS
ncbi:MAG TPA: universal stress protein [Gaiella sp.]|nr:universal stress protein [Gaiella sp.]